MVQLQGMLAGEIFEDAGISGATTERPGFKSAMRSALELGHEGVLVVYKLDRRTKCPRR